MFINAHSRIKIEYSCIWSEYMLSGNESGSCILDRTYIDHYLWSWIN